MGDKAHGVFQGLGGNRKFSHNKGGTFWRPKASWEVMKDPSWDAESETWQMTCVRAKRSKSKTPA
jgi:hypothetical protein